MNKIRFHNSNWETKCVSDLFEIETGSTPSTKIVEYWGGELNWVTPTDLSHNEGNVYISGSERKITAKALGENNLTLLPKKSLVLSTRAPVGYVAVLQNESAFNQGCKGLVPKAGICPEFYYYCFLAKQKLLENRSSGSTFKELATNLLEKVELPFPPRPQQEEIAELLMTLDAQVNLIDKKLKEIESIKLAVARKIFNSIPESKYTTLGNSVEFLLIMGQSPDSETYNSEGKGVPFLQGKADFGRISPQISVYTTAPYKIAQKGDILISVRAPVGDVNMSTCEVCLGRGLSAIRVLNGSAQFYFYWLQTHKKDIERLGAGAIFKAITKDQIEGVEVPLPSLSKQKELGKVLGDIDSKYGIEISRKEKLMTIRREVMRRLFSAQDN